MIPKPIGVLLFSSSFIPSSIVCCVSLSGDGLVYRTVYGRHDGFLDFYTNSLFSSLILQKFSIHYDFSPVSLIVFVEIIFHLPYYLFHDKKCMSFCWLWNGLRRIEFSLQLLMLSGGVVAEIWRDNNLFLFNANLNYFRSLTS